MKRVIKNNIFGFIVGAVIFGCLGVIAANAINARDIVYRNTNVESAIDDLYTNPAAKKFCELKSGTALTVGSKYECDPGDGVKRIFYILTVNQNTVDLIMEYNISDDAGSALETWTDAMKYFRSGAGATIKSAWTNILNIDLPKAQALADAVGYNWVASDSEATWWCFGSHAQDTNQDPFCNSASQSSKAWLYSRLRDCLASGCYSDTASAWGYWTRDLVANTNNAWFVSRSGYLKSTVITNDTSLGIRPVITVLKSNLYTAE